MELIVPSRSGLPTARKDGRYLHSAYDPDREALRFVRSRTFPRPPEVLLILGDALGYVTQAFLDTAPASRVLSAYCSTSFFAHRVRPSPERDLRSWHPDGGESFRSFLARHIRDSEIRGLRVVEWEPAFQAYPDRMRALLAEAVQFGREAAGSAVTAGFFGRRWIRNSVRNYLQAENPQVLDDCPGPVLIAASGPLLAEALPVMLKNRARFSLWALPSALDFLDSRGLEPDLVVLTDPGFPAGLHFHTLRRSSRRRGKGPPILHPLTAVALPPGEGLSSLLFHQGSPIEVSLLQGLDAHYYPAHGTVAGTAVRIALARSAGPIFIAGLDFAVRDLEEHVRPNAFDREAEAGIGRLRPLETGKYGRIIRFYPEKLGGSLRSSQSLKTYAGWFAARRFPGLYRLAPSPVATGIPEPPRGIWEALPRSSPPPRFRALPLPGLSDRAALVRRLVDGFLREIRRARTPEDLSPFARDLAEAVEPDLTFGPGDVPRTGTGGGFSEPLRESLAAFAESLLPFGRTSR